MTKSSVRNFAMVFIPLCGKGSTPSVSAKVRVPLLVFIQEQKLEQTDYKPQTFARPCRALWRTWA